MDMLIIDKQLNRFLALSLFVCEICIAFGAFFYGLVHVESNYSER